jgi:hypothetical protein
MKKGKEEKGSRRKMKDVESGFKKILTQLATSKNKI